jgi:biopolymer transport protein ExbD
MALRKFVEEDRQTNALNLMPLIDVVFNLLIFFLVATQFSQEEKALDVRLPESHEAKPITRAPKILVVNVHPDGRLLLGRNEVKEQRLLAVLRTSRANFPHQIVELRGDTAAFYGRMVRVISLCLEAGVPSSNIQLAVVEPRKT